MIPCVYYLSEQLANMILQASEQELFSPEFTHRDLYGQWLKEAYEEPGFLHQGDYMSIYLDCIEKDCDALTADETQAVVTFLIRQMRHAYEPYSCICDRSLGLYLKHYANLMKGESK